MGLKTLLRITLKINLTVLVFINKIDNKRIKNGIQHGTYCRAGFGGTPTADSRFAVPCPPDRNALRNPPRQHVPTVVCNFRGKMYN